VLTSLKPPSPASLVGPREVEFTPSRPLQTTPQLPGALPMTFPPGPENHRDGAESSSVTPVFKRWFQTRFANSNKNQASQPSDQLSAKSGRPVNTFNPQSEPTANITKGGLSRMAAGQRVRVSAFFFGIQQVCSMSDEASQRAVAKPVNWVRYSVCSLAPLLILCDSVRAIPRLLKRIIRSRTRPVADNGRQVQRKRVPWVSFQ
jgi:hypothetical protein